MEHSPSQKMWRVPIPVMEILLPFPKKMLEMVALPLLAISPPIESPSQSPSQSPWITIPFIVHQYPMNSHSYPTNVIISSKPTNKSPAVPSRWILRPSFMAFCLASSPLKSQSSQSSEDTWWLWWIFLPGLGGMSGLFSPENLGIFHSDLSDFRWESHPVWSCFSSKSSRKIGKSQFFQWDLMWDLPWLP